MKSSCSNPQNVKLMVLDQGYHVVGYCQRVYMLNKYCFGLKDSESNQYIHSVWECDGFDARLWQLVVPSAWRSPKPR